jgi:ribonuclease P protein component
MEVNHRFPSSERLKQKSLIDALFKGANRAFHHPVMAIWKPLELPFNAPIQVGFSVPKKHYKHSVKRNLIKRRLREAYRLQNDGLHATLAKQNGQIAVLFVMMKTDNISYEELQKKMMLLLRDIAAKIEHTK